jgi:magnesium transporter
LQKNKQKTDSLLDSTTDAMYPVVEWVLKQIQELEDDLLRRTPSELTSFNITGVRNVRKQLNYMHQMLRPMKEVLLKATADFEEGEGGGGSVSESGKDRVSSAALSAKYMRDVYSHLIQILEDIEVGQSECRDLIESYNMKIDNRQADILYVLTFVTIFITPLQLMSGIYGMNFAYIPELEWHSGYAYFWGTSLAMMVLLAVGFTRMGWLELPWWLEACVCWVQAVQRPSPSSSAGRGGGGGGRYQADRIKIKN